MRARGGRPQVSAYTWKTGERRTPGAMIKIPGAGRQMWIDGKDLAYVADGLIDVLEGLEAERLRDGLALLADDESAVTWADGESVTRVTDESQPSHTRTRKELTDPSVTRVTRPMIECPECGDLDCAGECVGGVR